MSSSGSAEDDAAALAFLVDVEEQSRLESDRGREEDPAVAELASLGEELLSDSPKLAEICKNLVSVCVANSQVAADQSVRMEDALLLARAVLQEVTRMDLPESSQWGILEGNGQCELQSGEDRIKQLARYKVCRVLSARVKSKGLKVSKTFGRKYLQWSNAWPIIRQNCASVRPPTMDEEVWRGIFDGFERALTLMSELPAGELDEAGDVEEMRLSANCDLLFAADFNSALAARKNKRLAEQIAV